MIKLRKLILGLCLLCSSTLVYSESAESPIWGAFSVECPANSDTYLSVVSTRQAVFKGIVKEIYDDDSFIVASENPNWSSNQFVFDGTNDHFYVKFTSGNLEGAWFDITSNTSNGISIFISNSELSLVEPSDTFEIIPHWTLDTLFPNAGGLTKSTGIIPKTGASMIWKYTAYTENGVECPIGINNAFSKSYYYREKNSDIGWRDGNGNVADLDVIEPNTFLLIRQPSKGAATVSYTGMVPMCATSFEIFSDGDEENYLDQDNYIAVPSVVDIKLSDLTECLIVSGAFKESTGIINVAEDILYLYSNEDTTLNRLPSKSYYYRRKGATDSWLDFGKQNANENVLKAGSGLIIKKKTNGASQIVRCTYYPPYLIK